MDFDGELASFFALEPEVVLANPQQFRHKLGIGLDTFKMLSKVENLTPLIQGGTIGTAVASAGFMSSAGILGAIGLASTPVGWVALAGVVGAGICYSSSKFYRGIKEDAVDHIPRYLNTAIDVIATSVFGFLSPIAIKFAYCDGQFSVAEREYLKKYFHEEWGFDDSYIEACLLESETLSESVDFDAISEQIEELASTGDVNEDVLIQQVISVCEGICLVEQSSDEQARHQLECLKEALQQGNASWMSMIGETRILTENAKDASIELADRALSESKRVIENSAELLKPKLDEVGKQSAELMKHTKTVSSSFANKGVSFLSEQFQKGQDALQAQLEAHQIEEKTVVKQKDSLISKSKSLFAKWKK